MNILVYKTQIVCTYRCRYVSVQAWMLGWLVCPMVHLIISKISIIQIIINRYVVRTYHYSKLLVADEEHFHLIELVYMPEHGHVFLSLHLKFKANYFYFINWKAKLGAMI